MSNAYLAAIGALVAFIPMFVSVFGRLRTAYSLKHEHLRFVEIRLGGGANLRADLDNPEEVERLADALTNSAGASLS